MVGTGAGQEVTGGGVEARVVQGRADGIDEKRKAGSARLGGISLHLRRRPGLATPTSPPIHLLNTFYSRIHKVTRHRQITADGLKAENRLFADRAVHVANCASVATSKASLILASRFSRPGSHLHSSFSVAFSSPPILHTSLHTHGAAILPPHQNRPLQMDFDSMQILPLSRRLSKLVL